MLEGLLKRNRSPERQARITARLEVPPFPAALEYIWVAYSRLSARRGSNGYSVNPISWPDIDAYLRHSQMPLAPWEIRLIEELDDLFRFEQGKKHDDIED